MAWTLEALPFACVRCAHVWPARNDVVYACAQCGVPALFRDPGHVALVESGREPYSAEAEHIPFPDGTFDAVFSVAAFSHFIDVGKIIAECRRVLKPGGKLAVVTENLLFAAYRLRFLVGDWRRFSRKMGRHFVNSMADMRTWMAWMAEHGFAPDKNLSNMLAIRGGRGVYGPPLLANLLAKHFAFSFRKR